MVCSRGRSICAVDSLPPCCLAMARLGSGAPCCTGGINGIVRGAARPHMNGCVGEPPLGLARFR